MTSGAGGGASWARAVPTQRSSAAASAVQAKHLRFIFVSPLLSREVAKKILGTASKSGCAKARPYRIVKEGGRLAAGRPDLRTGRPESIRWHAPRLPASRDRREHRAACGRGRRSHRRFPEPCCRGGA